MPAVSEPAEEDLDALLDSIIAVEESKGEGDTAASLGFGTSGAGEIDPLDMILAQEEEAQKKAQEEERRKAEVAGDDM